MLSMKKNITLVILGLLLCCGLSGQDLYDLNRVQELKIYFKEADWDVKLDSLKQLKTKQRMVADVKLNGLTYKDCGVRFKGNSSYNSARKVFGRKLPLNIKSDFVDSTQTFKGGYTSLKLANGFRDPSFVREVLSYEIARKYLPAPKANFIHVYINDKYYGLYTSVESINEKFMKDHFGDEQTTLIKCDPEYGIKPPSGCPKNAMKATLEFMGFDSLCYEVTYETKSDATDYKGLIQLTKRLKDNPQKAKEILNVDRALWMLAYNNVLVNLDSYTGRLSHNYYMAKDDAGRWNPLIWDLNLSFGGFTFDGTGKPLDAKGLQEMSPFLHYKNKERPLIHKLLTIDRNRRIYIAHMRTILNENFKNGQYYSRATQIQRTVDSAVRNDDSKFYSYNSFKDNLTKSSKAGKATIIGLKELMEPRTKFLLNHPVLQKTPPKISSVQGRKKGDKIVVNARVENATKVFVAYRSGDVGYFKKKIMKDDGASQDYQAGDQFYGVELDAIPNMQYYILSENDDAAMLHPERAEYEFLEVK